MFEEKLEQLNNRFHELEKSISDPSVISQNELYKNYLREHSLLAPVIQKYQELKHLNNELNNLEELKSSADDEIKKIAIIEYDEITEKIKNLESEIKLLLLPKDPNEEKNIIVEIRAGTGGDEAALFAGEIFRMYCRYAESKGSKIEVMDGHSTGLGGFKQVTFMISGKQAWKNFKYERGIHRVQRVPVTESSGRIHTSAISVAVLPEAEDIEVEVKNEDLRIDTYRSSGAGGQHVNKTDSAVRITHLPTNIVVTCQDERSQLKNRAKAMKILRAKLLEKKQMEYQQEITSNRRQQVGSGDRSEKIRTYNYPQNRVTDHRINFSIHKLEQVLNGDMEELVQKLIQEDNEEKLKNLEKIS
ncbi:MAG: peptide chain release factor 1 [Endomicrobiales bacterium]|nr:peptide chain release factor 1 [Endomicrobiales bacterium]